MQLDRIRGVVPIADLLQLQSAGLSRAALRARRPLFELFATLRTVASRHNGARLVSVCVSAGGQRFQVEAREDGSWIVREEKKPGRPRVIDPEWTARHHPWVVSEMRELSNVLRSVRVAGWDANTAAAATQCLHRLQLSLRRSAAPEEQWRFGWLSHLSVRERDGTLEMCVRGRDGVVALEIAPARTMKRKTSRPTLTWARFICGDFPPVECAGHLLARLSGASSSDAVRKAVHGGTGSE